MIVSVNLLISTLGLAAAFFQLKVPTAAEKSIKSFSFENVTVPETIKSMRTTYHVAVSFIESNFSADNSKKISINLKDATITDCLENITRQTVSYTYKVLANHAVVYPRAPKYSFEDASVDINSVPRLRAANKYAEGLRNHFPEFADFVGSVMQGEPKAPAYTELVSLTPGGTVLEHLIQLLGTSSTLAFSIVKTRSGAEIIFFEDVR